MLRLRYIFIMMLFVLNSCETWDYYTLDEFNFDGTEHEIKVFVQGGITTQNTQQRIFLYKPSDYFSGSNTENIVSADVYVTHNTDTFIFNPVLKYWSDYYEDSLELENPYYLSEKEFSAVVGEVYTLNIDYDGVLYYGMDSVVKASDFKFNEIPLPYVNYDHSYMSDDVEYVLELKRHHFGYAVANQWRWNVKRNISESENILYHLGGVAYSHQFADAQGLFSNIEYYTTFYYGEKESNDTLVVTRVSYSDGYYNYLYQKFMETDWTESVFSTLSGNLSTNMSSGAIGYFYASDLNSKEISTGDFLSLEGK